MSTSVAPAAICPPVAEHLPPGPAGIRLPAPDADSRPVLLSWGVRLESEDGETIVITLPPGWSWRRGRRFLDALDEEGRKRIWVATDAPAFTRAMCRHDTFWTFDELRGVRAQVKDGGRFVLWTGSLHVGDGRCIRARAEGVAWLEAHYPDWRDPSAYWPAVSP